MSLYDPNVHGEMNDGSMRLRPIQPGDESLPGFSSGFGQSPSGPPPYPGQQALPYEQPALTYESQVGRSQSGFQPNGPWNSGMSSAIGHTWESPLSSTLPSIWDSYTTKPSTDPTNSGASGMNYFGATKPSKSLVDYTRESSEKMLNGPNKRKYATMI
jgi:hypothetical protein